MSINVFQLDPRPQGAEANERFFTNPEILGIEVTIPTLASRCSLGNLDHHGSDSTSETPSACEQALSVRIPMPSYCGSGEEARQALEEFPVPAMATVRPDADSVTAMAVIVNRCQGRPVYDFIVLDVGAFDRLGPSAGEPSVSVIAIARKAADFKVPLAERVQWVADLLAGADKSQEVIALCVAHESELEAARKASTLNTVWVNTHVGGQCPVCANQFALRSADGGKTTYCDYGCSGNMGDGTPIAVVVSTHRFATTLGYEVAPVVVAMNPEMPVDPKDPSKGIYRKFTVCRYDSHIPCDLPAALKELQALEVGWGGRGDIFGSPQGVSSTLTVEQVTEVVSRHLK
jgi:hypothetical protein